MQPALLHIQMCLYLYVLLYFNSGDILCGVYTGDLIEL